MIGMATSEYKQILYSKENRVATVTLNRPEKLKGRPSRSALPSA
jgi:enoyl-CoA hydratase/carnithine racemase